MQIFKQFLAAYFAEIKNSIEVWHLRDKSLAILNKTRLGCFYVTAILSWGYGWGWVEVDIEAEVDLNLRLKWGWDEIESNFSWTWVEVELR